jgi:hypothetical protein
LRFEIGETLILSWLKHIKKCQITQLNWSPSNSLPINNKDEISKIMDSTLEFLHRKNNIKISTINFHKEFKQENNIGVIGIDIQTGETLNLYAVNYINDESYIIDEPSQTQIKVIIVQMIRTALYILGYFNTRNGDIIFVSPKIHKALVDPLVSVTESLNIIFNSLDLKFKFSLYLNEDFEKRIFEPVCHNLNVRTHPSELFLDSIKLYYSLFRENGYLKEDDLENSNVSGNTVSNHENQLEKIGTLIKREFSHLIEKGILTEDIIEQLTDTKFSKETFKLRYAMLKKINNSQSLYVQRMVNGYGRYYSHKYEINGKKYLLCNDWYERSRIELLNWLDKLNK